VVMLGKLDLAVFSATKVQSEIFYLVGNMSKSVTVLCPNGRREKVKVTPNTTVLQVTSDISKP